MRTPFLLRGLRIASLLGVLALAGSSAAQPSGQAPAPPKDDALDEIARKLYREGHKALEEKRWEQCRAAFLAAWKIKQQYQIAGNLAHCEAKLGLHREAGEHLRYFLREAPKDSPPERRQMGEALFDEVRAKVALVTVSVNKAGAEIVVDGVTVGKSPLPDALVLDPGAHTIEALFAGYPPVKKRIEAAAGTEPVVAIEIREPGAEPEKPKPAQEKPAVTTNPVQPQVPSEQARLPPEQPTLPVRKIVIGTGIGASAVLLGMGIGFAVASNGEGTKADTLGEPFKKQSAADACRVPGQNAERCEQIAEHLQNQTSFANVAVWTFVAGGIVGGGTLAYVLIAPSKVSTAAQVLPMVGPGGAGLTVRGQW